MHPTDQNNKKNDQRATHPDTEPQTKLEQTSRFSEVVRQHSSDNTAEQVEWGTRGWR